MSFLCSEAYTHGGRRYGASLVIVPCPDQFARVNAGQATAVVCVPASVQANGSAIPLYSSDTVYDDLLWAAAWMYSATADPAYLQDADEFYVQHVDLEGGSTTLVGALLMATPCMQPCPMLAQYSL